MVFKNNFEVFGLQWKVGWPYMENSRNFILLPNLCTVRPIWLNLATVLYPCTCHFDRMVSLMVQSSMPALLFTGFDWLYWDDKVTYDLWILRQLLMPPSYWLYCAIKLEICYNHLIWVALVKQMVRSRLQLLMMYISIFYCDRD